MSSALQSLGVQSSLLTETVTFSLRWETEKNRKGKCALLFGDVSPVFTHSDWWQVGTSHTSGFWVFSGAHLPPWPPERAGPCQRQPPLQRGGLGSRARQDGLCQPEVQLLAEGAASGTSCLSCAAVCTLMSRPLPAHRGVPLTAALWPE